MKLTFIGTGSAFTVGDDNYQSNMLLESDRGRRLLIDCGSDARFALHELGLSHMDIHDLYISHLHADHVGGLEWLAFCTNYGPEKKRIELYLNHTMSYSLWEHVLSGGLSSLEGAPDKLSYYFKVNEIDEMGIFTWEKTTFQTVQTIHVSTEHGQMPSYGLFFCHNGINVFITTDTQFNLDLYPFYEKADLIFHDCKTSEHVSVVHATYEELKQLPEEYKQKMWLYHYHPGELPDAVKDGFLGFVKKGQCFSF